MCITLSMTMLTSCTSCSSFWENIQTVGKGYQSKFEYKGTLEKKYAYDGYEYSTSRRKRLSMLSKRLRQKRKVSQTVLFVPLVMTPTILRFGI